MDNKPNEITFLSDDNEEEALILKDISKDTDVDAIYDIVDDGYTRYEIGSKIQEEFGQFNE